MKCKFCALFRRYVFQPLCGALMFNADMSLELDRLGIENEQLRDRLK